MDKRKVVRYLNVYAAFLTCLITCGKALANTCEHPLQLNPSPSSEWQGWGNGHANTRAAESGLNSAHLDSLTLRWAFAFDGASSSIGNPIVHDNILYIGSEDGTVYALDVRTACEYWRFKADNGVRTAPILEQVRGRWLLFFGDRNAQVYALDARVGRQVWKVNVEQHPAAILTGAPQFVHIEGERIADRLIIPVSSSEEGMAAIPGYNCCSFQGSVVSLDASNGSKIWQQHTIQSPVTATGNNSRGPSGAAIWSAPTIDLPNQRLYVTTGDAYSAPADIATDAVIGMDLLNGLLLWINPGTTGDIWTVNCLNPATAPDNCGPDQDYGSPAILITNNEHQYLVAGQKSGIVRAFSLAGGNILWSTLLVENPFEFGGKIIWGGASDEQHVYFGLGSGGFTALRLDNGEQQWFSPVETDSDLAAYSGHDGPLTVSEDLLIAGGWDGKLRILSAQDGAELWSYNTVQSYDSVNLLPAQGGSIGAVGQVVAAGRLFVSSGYVGVKNGIPGNVLLMFSHHD